jgi:hypothetical protein
MTSIGRIELPITDTQVSIAPLDRARSRSTNF